MNVRHNGLPDDVASRSHREPLRTTLTRTGMIALVAGAVWSRWLGGLSQLPFATLLMLWPSFGGHWVELWFLDYLRPRLPAARAAARLLVWFLGGVGLAFGMRLTAAALNRVWPARPLAWWLGGLAFVGIELVVHAALQLRGRPSFYNGRG